MDVWIEFKNASKWQAEALFRNFFPSTDKDDEPIEGDLEGIELPSTPAPRSPSFNSSTLWSMSPSFSSSSSSLASSTRNSQSPPESVTGSEAFGSKNRAYLPPPVEEHIAACQHSAKPLDGVKLAQLAKEFADSIPDDEFSVAALQGCKFVFNCDNVQGGFALNMSRLRGCWCIGGSKIFTDVAFLFSGTCRLAQEQITT